MSKRSTPTIGARTDDYCHACNQVQDRLVEISYRDDRNGGSEHYARFCKSCIAEMSMRCRFEVPGPTMNEVVTGGNA